MILLYIQTMSECQRQCDRSSMNILPISELIRTKYNEAITNYLKTWKTNILFSKRELLLFISFNEFFSTFASFFVFIIFLINSSV